MQELQRTTYEWRPSLSQFQISVLKAKQPLPFCFQQKSAVGPSINNHQPSSPPKKSSQVPFRAHGSPSAPLWATCWASRHSPIPRASHDASSKTSSKEPKERRWLAKQKRVCRFLLGMAIKANTTVCRIFFLGVGTNEKKMGKVKKRWKHMPNIIEICQWWSIQYQFLPYSLNHSSCTKQKHSSEST